MKAVRRLLSIALAAVLAGLLASEISRYRGLEFLHSGETLVLVASDSAEARQRRLYLGVADRDLRQARERLPDDPRPAFLLASVASMGGDHASAIEFLQQSLGIEERPETDMNLALNWMAAGNPEAAAADALRAVWISPPLEEQLPGASRGPVSATLRDLSHRLRQGDSSATPELSPLDTAARENHGKSSRE